MQSEKQTLNKNNIDLYLNELSKEIKKEFGRKANVELLIAGGAAIMINYSFRDSTTDIDAVISSQTSIKDAVNRVGDKHGLPNGWLNSDFKQTASYSPKIVAHSKFYKTFNQVLSVRIIEPEYLIAMKLKSNRKYKYDLSDVAGIIKEQKGLSIEKIINAAKDFYGDESFISDNTIKFLKQAFENSSYDFYNEVRLQEEKNKNTLVKFEQEYQNVLSSENVEDILYSISKKPDFDTVDLEENKKTIDDIIQIAKDKLINQNNENCINKNIKINNNYER